MKRATPVQIAVQTMTTYEETVTLARWAESDGIPAFTVADHYLGLREHDPSLDQLTVLAGVASETKDIQLSTLVSPITFRHPAVMLKVAATLDAVSGGRFTLGVGAGWHEREHAVFGLEFPPTSERFERLEEALAYLRAAMDPVGAGFEGRHYRLEPGFVPRPLPRRLRLVVGGSGARRTPALAGRFADEYNAFPDSRGDEAERVSLCRREAEAAGRNPEGLLYSTAFPPLVGGDQEEFDRRVRTVAAARGVEASELLRRYDELHIPTGTPDRLAEGIARLADAGIERIYLQVSGQPLGDISRSVEIFRQAVSR